ncbi:MAG: hypothetical protein Q8L07_12995 [Sediminibacterium sp.]|nr:hypothetical protein [Sediminibacterium sp.]MDP3667699.1 hypothetical protein [Sediminibacterium sp.]
MKQKNILLLSVLILTFACSKKDNAIVYKGEVIRQPNSCTSGAGFPFIIKYVNTNNQVDSFITTTLPIPYHFLNTKIVFEIRETRSSDEKIACTDLISIPKQMVIYNVSPQ